MFIVIKLDTYNSCGCSNPEEVYGPFATREEADAFEKRVSATKLVGIGFKVKQVLPEGQLIDWLSQLGYGEV